MSETFFRMVMAIVIAAVAVAIVAALIVKMS
jgi:hypothetical protein